jgi:hypothetical protein
MIVGIASRRRQTRGDDGWQWVGGPVRLRLEQSLTSLATPGQDPASCRWSE